MATNQSSNLLPCPFCGKNYAERAVDEFGDEYFTCEYCGGSSGTIDDACDWNTRPIEDVLNARIAELEGIVKADDLRLINAGLSVGLYSGCDTAEMMAEEILASRARIAELEAENAMLKQLPQPIKFWSDEKKQIYKINERRTVKSGSEECGE